MIFFMIGKLRVWYIVMIINSDKWANTKTTSECDSFVTAQNQLKHGFL